MLYLKLACSATAYVEMVYVDTTVRRDPRKRLVNEG